MEDEDEEERQINQAQCQQLFASTDYIMEPTIFSTLKRQDILWLDV